MHGVVQTGARQEDVHEIAVERVSRASESLELDGVVDLAALEVWNRRLADAHATRQLSARHAQRIADRPDPAAGRARLLHERLKPLQPRIEMPAGLGTDVGHSTSLTATPYRYKTNLSAVATGSITTLPATAD